MLEKAIKAVVLDPGVGHLQTETQEQLAAAMSLLKQEGRWPSEAGE